MDTRRKTAEERLRDEAARANGTPARSRPSPPAGAEPATGTAPKITTYTLGELMAAYPQMREPVIEDLLRLGETMNIIAASKRGKSWLVAFLAFAVATKRDWLGFHTTPGDVLIIDNELHKETLANRLRRIARANNIDLAEVEQRITIMPLRGRLTSLPALGEYFRALSPGRFRLIIIDAFYRALPLETDENDNAMVAGLYNLIDQYADHLHCSFSLIHHSSKGDQSQKRVTDVGSGAGSQSRAADTHLILRAHAEDDVVVLDAAVRSFPPIKPRCLRWEFPSFVAADDLDPAALRSDRSRRRPKAEEDSPKEKEPPWTAKRFAEMLGKPEPRPRAAVLEDARLVGLSDRRAEGLLKAAVDCGFLFAWKEAGANSKTLVATVKPPEPIAIPEDAPPRKPKARRTSKARK